MSLSIIWGGLLLLRGTFLALAAQPGPPASQVGVAALPPRLARVLVPRPDDPAQDVRRLRAVRAQWAGDSLGRLLGYSRQGANFSLLLQPDSVYHYLQLAWRQAGPSQKRQQAAEVIVVASGLANYYHIRGEYDSALVYYRHAIGLFQRAGIDSSRGITPTMILPTTQYWGGGWALAGSVANAGSALYHQGNLRQALRYYERARALYQQQRDLPGVIWTQCLVGEAYAEQGDASRAMPAYEQALRTTRRYQRRALKEGAHVLADLTLNYYAPLLLTQPGQEAYASRLATETVQALQAAYTPQELRTNYHDAALLAQLRLISAEAALRAGQAAAAAPYLRDAEQWIAYSRRASEKTEYQLAQVQTLGLRAWQQHTTSSLVSRRLLTQALALLATLRADNHQSLLSQQLASYCLAAGEPTLARQILRPLLRQGGRQLSPFARSQATGLLAQAYAKAGRYDSAYAYVRRTQALTDTMRAAQQFAALAATEARFRTREQATQIQLLTEREQRQAQRARLAALGAALLAALLLGAAAAWRTTRRLNQQLAAQSARLQQQAQQLSEVDAAKNQFFANVSHELRTPLTLVLGPLDNLLSAPSVPLAPAVQEPVALAHRHARRLLELVNRILDLTKLEAGRLELHPTPTALAPLLRRVVAQFESLAAEHRQALAFSSALPDDLRLLVDADKLEQILTNLLMNALKHTPAGGTVALNAAQPGPDGQYALTVRDTGPGIAAAEQARVFERYYQSPQQQAQGGTGLGLALSRDLATLLQGSLTLVSEPGQGAAFTLRFPAPVLAPGVAGGGADPPAQLALATPAGTRARVLVVEDQPDLRDYLRQLLAPTCEVLVAADGQEALAILAREAPVDLITTDAMMPRLSGTELLAHLRAAPAWVGIPVLMLTARADDAHRVAALTVGVDDYLTKPFVPAELLARVRALLARQQVRRHFAAQPAEPLPAPASNSTPLPTPVFPAAASAPAAPATELLAQWQARVAPALADPAFGPAELAGLLLLSERTLYRRLGELAGLTPAAWLRELRLDQARCLLEAGDFGSVAEVAETAGFANVKAFSTRYAERFGRRPGSYYSKR